MQILQDLRYGARMLWKKPSFTLIAVLTLSLGIGATTAIFSVVNAVLLRPLPYPQSERLVFVGQQYRGGNSAAGEPKYLFWREQQQSFEGLACYSSVGTRGGNLTGGNEAFVQKFGNGKDPFARQFSVGRNEAVRQIVGIVADTKQMGLDRPALPTVFVPLAQLSDKLMATARAFNFTHFTVRTTVDPATMQATLKREMAALDPALPLAGFRTMEDRMTRSVASQRFYMLLLGLFALLGLLLAAVGIYGVMSQSVAERTNEIGIRMALGAQRRDVLALVLGQGMKLALLGVVLGLAASFGLTRLMQGFLFGVSATNPLTFVAVTVLLTIVAVLACWLPAQRATKVDPLTALRYE